MNVHTYISQSMNEWDSKKYLHYIILISSKQLILIQSINHRKILIQKFNTFFNLPSKSKKKKKKKRIASKWSLKLGVKRERKTIILYLVFFSTNHSYEPDVWYPSCLSWPRYDLIVTGLTIGQGCTVERMAEQIGLSRKTAASVNITVNTFGFRAAWRWLTARPGKAS